MKDSQLKPGYAVARFPVRPPVSFLCLLCRQVVRRPVECTHCGVLYCGLCSTAFWAFHRQPHSQCQACFQPSHFKSVTRALKRVIGRLELRCKHDFCGQVLTLREIERHQRWCSCKPVRCHWCGQGGLFGEFRDAAQASLVVCSQHCAALSEFQRSVKAGRAQEALAQYWFVLKNLSTN